MRIQKTNPDPDPLKFGQDPDPDPGLYGLKRTSDTKSTKEKKRACKIIK